MFAAVIPLILASSAVLANLSQGTVAEARRLRDSGQFVEAIRVLDDRLRDHPDDAEAMRLRAQTLYWLNDFARARASYAEALNRHPKDERLRVEYARMLAETNDRRGALELLEPLDRSGQGSADAHALLGTILYWQGDLSGAKRHFRRALDADPTNRDAVRQLEEILQISSPWLRLEPVIWHDDQPLDRQGIVIEAGWFATPLFSISARSAPMRYLTTIAQTFWSNEMEIAHYAPRARVESRFGAGVFRRPGPTDTFAWTGHADLGLRAARNVTIRGRLQRAPYLHTVASLETPTDTTIVWGMVQLNDRRGWLGEAAIQRQMFPDSNAILSTYAWLMAPIARGSRSLLQAGYAFGAADSDEDRFAFSGIYDPYFTPQRVVTHSVIGAFTAGTHGPVLRVGGSYALRAQEDATSFQAVGGEIISVVGRRSYTPWTLRGSLDIPAGGGVTFVVGAESGRTAYYHWTTARVQLNYRFLPHAAASVPKP